MGAGQNVTFAGAGADLALYNPSGFGAQIAGFAAGDTIDLGTLAYAGGNTVSWTPSGTSGTLTVTNGGNAVHLTLAGSYVTNDFALSNDGHNHTNVTYV
jgi:hypothetical protein